MKGGFEEVCEEGREEGRTEDDGKYALGTGQKQSNAAGQLLAAPQINDAIPIRRSFACCQGKVTA
jgi:hypothetical protein